MTNRSENPPFTARILRAAVTLFILFHLVTFTLWTAPLNFPLLDKYRALVRPYLLWTGLFQAWNMFAPDPLRLNTYLEAEVRMANGEIRVWHEPRMDKLGIVQKYFEERYRKYMNEHLRVDEDAALWPDAARHIARLYDTDKSNPPMSVRLIRYWSEILPPSPDGQYRTSPWSHYVYFKYNVAPEDLE
jgi:hypothetical protein